MEDLNSLAQADGTQPRQLPSTPSLRTQNSPLQPRLQAWQQGLQSHPDKQFVAYILDGIANGFRIGCRHGSYAVAPVYGAGKDKNLRSAYENPTAITEYIETELVSHRVIALSQENAMADGVRVSPIGVIPKKNQKNKWRMIHDLSSPNGSSVNDGISKEVSSISYESVDSAAAKMQACGKGAIMAKLDLRHAYQVVPTHPKDRPLLGMQWQGRILIDTALPFGLRSAPKIFSSVADALLWVMRWRGVKRGIHYLDDFFFVGAPDSTECADALRTALQVCSELGMPVALEKLEGPATAISFLGIYLDSTLMQLKLPSDKLGNLRKLLASWSTRRNATKRELLSLIGHLQHAASIVKPGRTFLRHLINLSTSVSKLHHYVHLRGSISADLLWWSLFVEQWNGLSVIPPSAPSYDLVSDASGSWGCGAFWPGHWLQLRWPTHWSNITIAPKELVPIVLAVAPWGHHWGGLRIRAQCDNMAVVFAINTGRARDKLLMQLLRYLYFYCAEYNITLSASHLRGAENSVADAISRNQMATFFSLVPQAPPQATPVHPALVKMLLGTQLKEWTSPLWKQLFHSSLNRVSRPQPPEHIHQGPEGT